jgi:2-methylcitrate dehydratase PrpD
MNRADTPYAVRALSAEAVRAGRAEMPAAAQRAAETALLDWAGVTLAGSGGRLATALAAAEPAPGGNCRLVGRDARASAPCAALVNGTAAHTLELDDIYAPGLFHPGAPVIAAALAAGEAAGTSGEQFLRAIIVGYEVGGRVAADLGPEHYRMFHTTGTAGSIAAAAATGTVLGLDEDQMTAALSMAATMAAGLQQTFRSSAAAKPLHAGHAAQSGVLAAMAARGGAEGAVDILEGEAGMGAAMSNSPDWDACRQPFGPSYLIEQTTVKAYPCCGHTFPAIDGALELLDRGLATADISSVGVQTYEAAVQVAGIAAPRSPAEARFSIPFVVAAAFADGAVTRPTFTSAALAREEIREMMARISVSPDDEFSHRFPAMRGARVTVTLHSGKQASAVIPDRTGSPNNPMTADQLKRKFTALAAPVRGDERARAAIAAFSSIGQLTDVRSLPI